ncbi:hypothetical protein HN51_002941 [Arachis hypogaea]
MGTIFLETRSRTLHGYSVGEESRSCNFFLKVLGRYPSHVTKRRLKEVEHRMKELEMKLNLKNQNEIGS